jgi:transmembrane sensor
MTVFALAAVAGAYLWQQQGGAHVTTISKLYSTTAGQRSTVTLADGSTALLGPATTMRVLEGTNVDVELSGQAMFTVTPMKERGFTVHTGGFTTRVLGTTFFVKRYASDSVTQVVVAEGRVAVEEKESARPTLTVLQARDVGTFRDSGDAHVEHGGTSSYAAWTRDKLVFRDAPLNDIASELSRMYSVDVRVTDSTLRQSRMNFTVSPTTALADVLDALANTLDAHVARTGNVLTIVPGAPPKGRRDAVPASLKPEIQHGR